MKKVKKTVQGGVVNLTSVKEGILGREFENLQEFLHGNEDVELYSANKQQAERYYDKIKEGNEYSIFIRKDLIDIRECDSDVCDYFVKIPVSGRYGGVKVPVNAHVEIGEDWEVCESKLFREDGRFFLNVTVEIEVEEVEETEERSTLLTGGRKQGGGENVPDCRVHSWSLWSLTRDLPSREGTGYMYPGQSSETIGGGKFGNK